MAQAARQNLRMQKELKLLLTDPPPGVSLSNDPSSSSSSSSFSLSNIDADIKGPEGTVYANGVFKIKIQIPDRYPFQPPNVTFATPIYHPNIDTGGRICLDILNLPPKGAWQPSLNISTVLMSIGLLLSEPNPDDGLMCEASREYKYNRQTFDQKARSMTEKYAKPGICGSNIGSTPANPSPLMMGAEGDNLKPQNANNEYNVDRKKLSRVSRKLSLESSAPSQKRNDDVKDNVDSIDKSSFLHSQSLFVNSSTILPVEQPPRQAITSIVENESVIVSPKKLFGNVHKLSLNSYGLPQRMDKNEKENAAQPLSFNTDTKIVSVASSNPSQPRNGNQVDQQSHHKVDADNGSSQSHKKLSGIGRRLSLHSACSPQRSKDGEENILHPRSVSLPSVVSKSSLMPLNDNRERKQAQEVYNENANKGTISKSSKKSVISKKLSLGMSNKSKGDDDENKENVPPNYQLTSESSPMTVSSFTSPGSGEPRAANGSSIVGHSKPFGISKKASLMQSSGLTQRKDADVLAVEKLSSPYAQSRGKVSSKSMQSPHDRENEKAVPSPITDEIIVLDSEDSDEDVKAPVRSRLSIGRKSLAGKRKVTA